jgi:hypothetical protein
MMLCFCDFCCEGSTKLLPLQLRETQDFWQVGNEISIDRKRANTAHELIQPPRQIQPKPTVSRLFVPFQDAKKTRSTPRIKNAIRGNASRKGGGIAKKSQRTIPNATSNHQN